MKWKIWNPRFLVRLAYWSPHISCIDVQQAKVTKRLIRIHIGPFCTKFCVTVRNSFGFACPCIVPPSTKDKGQNKDKDTTSFREEPKKKDEFVAFSFINLLIHFLRQKKLTK